MNPIALTVGGTLVDRRLDDAEALLLGYLTDDGRRYLDYELASSPDVLVPDDLAVTILINSRVGGEAFKSVQDHGSTLDLRSLPNKPLEDTSSQERTLIAKSIDQVASWRGLATSTATKVMHKKRPALIPILDNEAIFGAYLNPRWPAERARQDSVYGARRINEALDAIALDLTRPVNSEVWPVLSRLQPSRSRIQLFDMVWWTYFRDHQPVRRPA